VALDPGHFLLPRAKETNPERNLGQISPSTPRLASVRQAQIPPKPSFSGNGDADLPENQNPFTLRGNAERRYQMKPAENEILQFRRTSPGFPASIAIEPFINAKQASELLHLSAKTLLRFARQGIVPAHPLTGKIRRQWRFLESELYAWAHERVNLRTSDPCLNSRRK